MFYPSRKYIENYQGGYELDLTDSLVKIKMAADKLIESPQERVIVVHRSAQMVEFLDHVCRGNKVFPRPATFLHQEHSDVECQKVLSSFYDFSDAIVIASEQMLPYFTDKSVDRIITMVSSSPNEVNRILKPPYKLTILIKGDT